MKPNYHLNTFKYLVSLLIFFIFVNFYYFSFFFSSYSPSTFEKNTKIMHIKPDPGAAPDFVKAYAESSTSIRVVWKPPPVGKRNGEIIYYKIFYVPSTVPSTR